MFLVGFNPDLTCWVIILLGTTYLLIHMMGHRNYQNGNSVGEQQEVLNWFRINLLVFIQIVNIFFSTSSYDETILGDCYHYVDDP